jgi:hypothetical protein
LSPQAGVAIQQAVLPTQLVNVSRQKWQPGKGPVAEYIQLLGHLNIRHLIQQVVNGSQRLRRGRDYSGGLRIERAASLVVSSANAPQMPVIPDTHARVHHLAKLLSFP